MPDGNSAVGPMDYGPCRSSPLGSRRWADGLGTDGRIFPQWTDGQLWDGRSCRGLVCVCSVNRDGLQLPVLQASPLACPEGNCRCEPSRWSGKEKVQLGSDPTLHIGAKLSWHAVEGPAGLPARQSYDDCRAGKRSTLGIPAAITCEGGPAGVRLLPSAPVRLGDGESSTSRCRHLGVCPTRPTGGLCRDKTSKQYREYQQEYRQSCSSCD
jgi:hypothetical protein